MEIIAKISPVDKLVIVLVTIQGISMHETGHIMLCDNCGKEGARLRKEARTYGSGEDLLVI